MKRYWSKLKYAIGRKLINEFLWENPDRAIFVIKELMNFARCKLAQRDYEELKKDLSS
tara:strand:- start:20737 stop:20910 length:174 start_codon:yes stop_codon:yes gene_type:complete